MPEETFETLIAYCRENERVCPLPIPWNGLWDMLQDKSKSDAIQKPSAPLILAAWHHTSNLDKMVRLGDHVKWANEHGILEKVSTFLRALPEAEWHHSRN
jgi:hypothetical protein